MPRDYGPARVSSQFRIDHTSGDRFAVRDLVPSRTVGIYTEALQEGGRGRKRQVVAAYRSLGRTHHELPLHSHTNDTDRQASASLIFLFSSALLDFPEIVADRRPDATKAFQAACSTYPPSPEE